MANLSEPAPVGWLTEFAARPAAGAAPGWIAALAQTEAAPRGFSDASPFAALPEPVPLPAPPASPPPGPDPEQAAFARGFADGQAEAMREAEAALREQAEQVRHLRLAFRNLDQAAIQALADDLRQTVLALCGAVLGDYALDEAALLARCEAAAARLGGAADTLALALNPATLAMLDPAALEGWQVNPDPGLAPGALRLTGAGTDGAVRDGPEDWLRAIRAAIGEEQGMA
jgi:flagellar assembly protein FliH